MAERRRASSASGRRVPLLRATAAALLLVQAADRGVDGQWTGGTQWGGGGCCDLAASQAQYQQSTTFDDASCTRACSAHLCGQGYLPLGTDQVCTCHSRQVQECGTVCPDVLLNNGQCDELDGTDGMAAQCLRGTDEVDCRPPDTHKVRPTEYPRTAFGTPMRGEVASAGSRAWFQFVAESGTTYVLEAHGVAGASGLDDPSMELYDARNTLPVLLAENDDAPDGGGTLDSYIEWTCGSSGNYMVSISGFGPAVGWFTLDINDAGSPMYTEDGNQEVEPVTGDPCNGGSTSTKSGGEISFEPVSGQPQVCAWSIICPNPHEVVSLDFNEFQLSGTAEYIVLLDSPSPYADERVMGVDGKPLPPLTGSRDDLLYSTGGTTYVSSASALTVHFQSMGSYGGRPDDHFTASYMCSEAPPKPHKGGGWLDWEVLLLISIMLATSCVNLTVMKRRRARLQMPAGRAPLVPAIEAVATPVGDVETAMNPASGSVSLVASPHSPDTPGVSVSGMASPSPMNRTASALTDRWECPVCHRDNAAYRTRCEGCPGPSPHGGAPSPVSVVGTALVASPVADPLSGGGGGGGGGSALVVQSSVVMGVAMETLNSLLRACSLEQYEHSLQDLGVIEADDLKTLGDEQLESLGMKPVEVERLRRRLQ